MAHIVPFRAIRPTIDKAHLVASRSYVSYQAAALKRKLLENPFTFIHIINPEFGRQSATRPNTVERFALIRDKFNEFMAEGIFQQDEEPSFYIYRQLSGQFAFSGIICGVSIDDYIEGNIKIHEHTLTSREETFCSYLDTCNFNAEPVLLTYRENNAEIKALLHAKMTQRPEFDFTTTDRHRHQLWCISEKDMLHQIQQSFSHIPTLYIADGHHRMASSALLGQKRRAHAVQGNAAMYNYALAMLMPSELIEIEAFHRLVKMDFSLDEADFLQKLSNIFVIQKLAKPFSPYEKRKWGMRLKSGWYSIHLKTPVTSKKKSEQLDAMILSRHILEPMFHIHDQKTDKRIQFIPGNEALDTYTAGIDKGHYTVLFTLAPVNADELFAVADAGEVMPPKSTWIAPKLRSGLTIMSLD